MDQGSADRRALAELLLRRELDAARERATIRPRPDPHLPAPLSVAQWRIWFVTRVHPESAVYNEITALRVRGRVDRGALERSVADVIGRHEILRTGFVMADGEPAQVAVPVATARLRTASFIALPGPEREEAALRHLRAVAAEPFSIDCPPLLRLDLADLGDDEIIAVTLHHLLSDGWSVRLLLGEIMAGYVARAGGRPPELPPLPIQYADYAVWQRGQLRAGGVIAGQLDYWRRQLAGVPHEGVLHTDHPRPPAQTYNGAEVAFAVRPGLTRRLRELGQSEGATLFMTLLAAFQVLLARYSGGTDIVVGTPVANRSRAELEGLIGCFINTIALRTEVSGELTFRALLARARQTVVAGFAHQEVPFDRVVEALAPPRDPSRSPLFQVMLVLHNEPPVVPAIPGLDVSGVTVLSQTAKFDLTLSFIESPCELQGRLEYNTDLFAPGTIERMARQLGLLLAALTADPDRRVDKLPLLDDAEREAIREHWQAPLSGLSGLSGSYGLAGECVVHHAFERQAARTPDAVAVVDGDRQISYRQLDEAAVRLAARLRARGVAAGDFVALCLDRSFELVVAVLAVLKAGAAYVPLDPADPAERLAFILADAGPRVLVTQPGLAARTPAAAVPTLLVGPDAKDAEAGDAQAGEVQAGGVAGPRPVRPTDLAYMIYTSGTTGRPKGVVVEHRQVMWLHAAMAQRTGPRADDVWTLLHSYCFDVSVFELWGALLHGGRLVIVSRAASRSPAELRRLTAAQQVTVICQTPTVFSGFVEADRRAPDPELALRLIVLAGERLEPRRLGDWYAAHRDDAPRVVNAFGPTEATVYATFRPMAASDAHAAGSYIGRELPDARLLVVDAGLAPVPTGVVGELLIAGAGVSRGYHRRPGLTAQRFIPDPLGCGWRCYRTGDLVRLAGDGDIEFVRRADQQVKVRGHRVELGEVEAALRSHPEVADAVVTAVPDPGSGVRLVGYAVGGAAAPPLRELRAFLAARLPGHMVPSALAYLPDLPVTVNGKVNRAALPPVAVEQAAVGEVYAAPRTRLERTLAAVWKDLLGVDRVGLDDNFFELGGHSVLAIALQERLRDRQIELDVLDLFACPTVRGLAERVTVGSRDSTRLADAHGRAARRRAVRRGPAMARGASGASEGE
jgi:amino acid adenylation domain-containing protein